MEFDFEQSGTVADVSTVPETFRGLYVEAQGEDGATVYKLADNVRPLVDAYVGTNKSLVQTRADKKAASDEAMQRRLTKKGVLDFAQNLGIESVNEDEPLESVSSYISELTDQVKGGKELKVNLDKIRAESQTRIDEAVNVERAKTDKMQQALERYLVGEAAAAAIADAKGSRELLLPIIKEKIRVVQDGEDFVVRVVDTQGDFRSNGSGGWMDVGGLVSEMKTQDAYARAFESETPSGTGARPGSMQQAPRQQQRELTPNEKIGLGLRKGQYNDGRGSAARP